MEGHCYLVQQSELVRQLSQEGGGHASKNTQVLCRLPTSRLHFYVLHLSGTKFGYTLRRQKLYVLVFLSSIVHKTTLQRVKLCYNYNA